MTDAWNRILDVAAPFFLGKGSDGALKGKFGSSMPGTLVLGSGTSTGVPLVGCECAVCSSRDPRDFRMRSSVYVTCGGYSVLIDASPDFRWQALRFGIPRVDAVLITHPHADHILGLDDIRRYNTMQNGSIDLYARDFSIRMLRNIFGYAERPYTKRNGAMYRPMLHFNCVEDEPFEIGPFKVRSFEVPHGPVPSSGFRIDACGFSFVYVPDCHGMTSTFENLAHGADVMMLDGLRPRPHPSHLTIDTSVSLMRELDVKLGFFTHIGHDVTHADLENEFSGNVRPAYDGLYVGWNGEVA